MRPCLERPTRSSNLFPFIASIIFADPRYCPLHGEYTGAKKETDTASFKTPDLRNVLVTGPYFHDGSQETLWDVMDHYNKGDGLKNPYLDEDIEPLALSEGDFDDLVAFLASLTSPVYKEQGAKELVRQRELSLTTRPQRDTARAFGPKPPRGG